VDKPQGEKRDRQATNESGKPSEAYFIWNENHSMYTIPVEE
jgi:hypothetical protein